MAMSVVTPIGSFSAGSSSPAGLSGINGNDFLKILIKQLQFQDPFQPVTNQEMISQMSTIRQLETNTQLSQHLDQVTQQQRYGSAAALIGKYARGVVTDGQGNEFPIEGIITSVRFTAKGDAVLELDNGELMPMAALREVTTVDGATED